MTTFKHIVSANEEDMEVREIMREHFDFSARLRNRVKREKLVKRNGLQTEGWHRVREGDVISVTLPDEQSNFPPEDIPLDIVFEDNDIMIINKQPGLIVHPTKGHPYGTVANALSYYMQEKEQAWKIRFVNRLDMDTSGLLVIAKNSYCQNEYTNQSRKNQVKKRYIAIVKGIIEEENGTIDLPIGRPDPVDVRRAVIEGGSPSVTHYTVLERYEKTGFTLVELLLETGRTHQIRVHMSFIGHPILGDHLYGGEDVRLIERQALHAAKLEFKHPITKEKLKLTAPIPQDMMDAIDKIK
ncbi:MAG: RluA family pseudouridine synthase [Firmicutes bacterium]|nr:RluA family pseudouridine synthase [Bacillota bacterium]